MKFLKFFLIASILFIISCKSAENNHNIENYKFLRSEFQENLDSIWKIATSEEKEYLKFLYNNLPLSDIVEYSPDYHYNNIKAAQQTKEIFSWGKNLAETEFKHFVLPYRVNNENLDTSRAFFMNEIKARVSNMSMLEAAMEVNHWCHEHVTYKASDARTSSPLATYKNGFGRCGEESTFTVAALRSIGIPSRQVYTPRWAHSDDNHAWVEFWADGKWYFYGACEPAAEVNQAWFTEPARRAMLVNTRVIGDYNGSERVLNKTEKYSILNTLNVYAETKNITVGVKNSDNKFIQDAKVEFLLYNYAEFYPIAIKKTNKNGYCNFQTGYGDIIVWASENDEFNFEKVDLRQKDTLIITLNNSKNDYKISLNINPPIEKEPLEVDKSKKEINDKRLAYEDSLRAEYEKTFIDSNSMLIFAEKYNINKSDLINILIKSRANWNQILLTFKNIPENKYSLALKLFQNVNEKDLRDTPHKIFIDHIINTEENIKIDSLIFEKYILNPRIRYELISDYRGFLRNAFSEVSVNNDSQIANFLKQFLNDSIKILEKENFYNVAISPEAVYKSKVADKISANLFLISSLRSLGVAAREEAGTWNPQFYDSKSQIWQTIDFEISEEKQTEKSFLSLRSSNPDLKYFKHFTISQFVNGSFKTLQYQWDKNISSFDDTLMLSPGYYRLTTGKRLKNGSVLAEFRFFNLIENQHKTLKIELREDLEKDKTIAKIDSNFKYHSNKGIEIYIWLEAGTEPTNHIINDIVKLKDKFQQRNIEYNILTSENTVNEKLNKKFSSLPGNPKFLIDYNFEALKYIENKTSKELKNHLPIVIIRKNNDIIFLSRGYIIGIGEEILNLF